MSAAPALAAMLAAAVWPNEARLALVSAASILIEAAPFALAGVFAQYIFPRASRVVAYAGCGCSVGPSARSIPAAALAWLAFGPLPALARLAAATIVARGLHRAVRGHCTHDRPDFAAELERLLPFAVAAAAGTQIGTRIDLAHAHLALQIAGGAALGFFSSPCGLGSVAVAAALRAHAPAAATAFLCVAGIVDLHALRRTPAPVAGRGDAFAYALLATGAGLVAFQHGAQLVRPAFAWALALCAAAAAAFAVARRKERTKRIPIAPAVVLLGALASAPAPVYRATETTMAGLFPGERLSFTGVVARDEHRAALVRYAITCCRADAAPLAIRLTQPPHAALGTWARAGGVVVATAGGFALLVERITPVPPPADPFLYW